jgi:Ca-activated chloride channel family protein
MKKINFSVFGLLITALWLVFGAAFFVSRAQQTQPSSNVKRSPSQTPTPPNQKQNVLPSPKPTSTPSSGDDPDEVIKVENDLVNLSVRVVDRNGRIVSDVRPEEFKVFEDGVPQKVDFVSKEDVPINYGLVVDNSGSIRNQLAKVVDAGKIMIAANKQEDAAFVIRFISSEKIEILQEFTKSKDDLNDALENMYPEGGQTAIIDAVLLAAQKASEYEKGKRTEDKSRRALVLITDGEDRASYYKEEELFRQLREADVQIYPIGFVNELSKDDGGIIKKSSRDKAVKLLERMAQETGGKAYFPNSLEELPEIARSINNELRTQYSIGYAPTNDKRDGTFRAIKVVINEDTKRGHRIPITKTGRTAPKS